MFPLYEPRGTEPQHQSLASESKTHECANPAYTATGALEEIDKAMGTAEFVSTRPQQNTRFDI
jgi:hypothetical protein